MIRIAVIATFTHPSRLPLKEPSIMQSAVPELVASLCPDDAEVELYNEKEADIPLDRRWDLVFFSYLHSYYEHTKVLSTLLRRRGTLTVAGGRHASYFAEDCLRYFDAVVTGDPESNVPVLIEDFRRGRLRRLYGRKGAGTGAMRPYRYDLIDFRTNRRRLPGIEASRGCPFSCNFCVLTGHESYRFRPVREVVEEIQFKMSWNRNYLGLLEGWFIFLDNNLGGSPEYLRELASALVPLRKTWGCALTFNVLRDEELVRLLGKAGCRYIYTGLESLNPDSIRSMNKGQNRIGEAGAVVRRCLGHGILLSFGLLVGADGDTNEYLERLPKYVADLRYGTVTFLGIVSPYPETPFFRTLQAQGRLLPGSLSRDYDGYTLCHRPLRMEPSEVVDHFSRLARELSSVTQVARHYWAKLGLCDLMDYRTTIIASGPEVRSIRNALKNGKRRYIAGLDPLEEWDAGMMTQLGLEPQRIS